VDAACSTGIARIVTPPKRIVAALGMPVSCLDFGVAELEDRVVSGPANGPWGFDYQLASIVAPTVLRHKEFRRLALRWGIVKRLESRASGD